MIHAAGGLSEVDLNRAGVPLLEIVTEPDLRSPADARGCLEELRLTLRYLGVSDCEMQEGSLRCDANVNLHIRTDDGKTVATPIVEIKNMNSFSAVEKALHYEAERQFEKWKDDGLTIKDAPKETRGWSDPDGITKPQRQKETAADYRYFPEPDLVPVEVDDAWIDRLRAEIGELPMARRRRFEQEYGLSAYDANVLVEQGQDVADYFDAVARATGEAKLASNWVQQDVLRTVKEKKLALADFPVGPDALADLINRVKRKQLNTNQGREVLARMIETGRPADAIIAEGGYGLIGDRDELARGRRRDHRGEPEGAGRPERRQEEARGRQGLAPRPGDEADPGQGRPGSSSSSCSMNSSRRLRAEPPSDWRPWAAGSVSESSRRRRIPMSNRPGPAIGLIPLFLLLGTPLLDAGEFEIRRVFGPEVPTGPYKHPACMTELENGDLYLVYYGGEGEYATETAVYGSRLSKGGTEWSPPVPIAHDPFRSAGNGVIWEAPDGLVWLFYVVRDGETWSTSRIQFKVSEDGARTWSDASVLSLEAGTMVRNRPIALADGGYLLPAYHETGNDPELVGPDSTSLFYRFDPELRTWAEGGRIRSPRGNIQPAVAEVGDGHLIAYCRRGGGYGPDERGFLVRAESHDGGRTWTEGVDSRFPNPNAAVDFLKLRSGSLLLVYNDSMNQRTPLTVALSDDGDRTWPDRRNIVEGAGDYAYPIAFQARDGKIHVVFTSERRTVINHAVFDEGWVSTGE